MMKIKLLGLGNTRHRRLSSNLRAALRQLAISAEIIQITEIEDILSYKVAAIPALLMGKSTLTADQEVPSVEEICHFIEGEAMPSSSMDFKSAGE